MAIRDDDFRNFVRGDEKAFEAIFNEYYKTLVSYSMRHGLEQMEAEDVVIEMFHHVWQIRQEIESPAALHTLLYTATRNRSLNVLRNLQNRKRLLEENYRPEEEEEPRDYVAEEEMSRLLDEAVAQLTGQCKVVVTDLLKGKSLQEIADEMGVSVNTVKTYKARAIDALKDLLRDSPYLLLAILIRIVK